MQLYLLYLQIIPTFVPIKSNPIINKTSTTFMMKVNNPRKKRR